MKLLSKYNRIYLTASLIVFLITGIGYYYVVRYVLIDQLDDSLKVELTEINNYVHLNNAIPPESNTKNQDIYFKPTGNKTAKVKYSNVSEYDSDEKEVITFRQLHTIITVKGHNYEVTIREPQTETEDLLGLIFSITFIIAAFFILLLFIINRLLLQKVWKPFQHTLSQIQRFNLSKQNEITVQPTDITEFTELNNAVLSMSGKVNQEYHSLKNFTENASHEMQTPLAILNARLDLLIQNENLSEKDSGQIQEMYEAVNRLARLNKSLLLLTKIENRQYSETDSIQLDQLINEKLVQFADLIKAHNLTVETDIQPTTLKLNHHLADIVINNLLGNAIKHNLDNGSITISLEQDELMISNTGNQENVDVSKVFDRFQKSVESEGLGLGLAIVKQICDQYNYIVRYSFVDDLHIIRLIF
jgi:signal transduction histidine kinase